MHMTKDTFFGSHSGMRIVGMYFWCFFLLPVLIAESLESIPVILLCGVE